MTENPIPFFRYSQKQDGAKTVVFAPCPHELRKHPKTLENMLQNYGAKDTLHNDTVFLVFAP